MSLLARLLDRTRPLLELDRPLLVAVSGGPDSVALFDLLVAVGAAESPGMVVAHADHGIHPHSEAVAERVALLAASHRVPCEIGRLHLGPDATETAAREARYRWLRDLKGRLDASVIVTAHHADDQAETVLLRVLGGSGPAGLAAMSERHGDIARPLLGATRAELQDYVRERGLNAWADPANEDPRHLRSWIRSRLLPGIARRVPDVRRNLLLVAEQAQLNRTALDQMIDLLPGLDPRRETDGISVAAPVLASYDSPVGQMVLQAAARRAGFTLGGTRARRIIAWLPGARSGGTIELGGGWAAELAFDRLRLARGIPGTVPALVFGPDAGELLWNGWRVTWRHEPAPERQARDGWHAWFEPGTYVVRSRQPAERIEPLGMKGSRLVSRCLQEGRVPRSLRARWPIIEAGNRVVWIPGVCRSAALVPAPGMESVRADVSDA